MMEKHGKIDRLRVIGSLVICTALAGFAPLAAQQTSPPPADAGHMQGTSTVPAAKPLPQPGTSGEKQGFIRRQVGRDVNPDQPAADARPLPPPAKPGETQGFIRRQVGRDVNPDQQPAAGPKPPVNRGVGTPPAPASSTGDPRS